MATTAATIQTYYQNILLRTGSAAEVQGWVNLVTNQGLSLATVESAFVASAEAQTNVLPVVELYQADLGRAPDPAGLAAWVHMYESGASLLTISNGLAGSPEGLKYSGGPTPTAAFISTLYQNTLNRAASASEITYWVTTSGLTDPQIEYDIAESAEAQKALATPANSYLTTVGNGGSVTGSLFSAGNGTGGNIFTLTTGADNIPGLIGSNGTAATGNDVINGLVDATGTGTASTLSGADTINGGAGANTLNITVANVAPGDDANSALISNVQTVNIRSTVGSSLNANNVPGVTAVNSNLSAGALTLTNLPTGASVGLIGNGSAVLGALSATYVATATAATLNISGGIAATGAPAVTIVGAGVTSTTVNSSGASNTLGGLTLPATSKSLTVAAGSNLALGGVTDAALATVTVAGSASSVNIGADTSGATLTSISASGLTAGGVQATVGTPAAAFTFTGGGGSGNNLTFGAGGLAALTSGSQLNGGSTAGNTLTTLDVAISAATTALNAAINASTNFQTLAMNGATATLDQSKITNAAITGVEFGSAGAVTVTNATTAERYGISTAGGGGLVSLTGGLGQNTLSLNLDGTATASVTATGFTFVPTTINLSSNGSFTTANMIGTAPVTLTDSSTLNILGSEALTILTASPITDATAGGVGEIVNASTFTGKLTVDETGGNSKVVFTTGSGGGAITASTAQINNFTLGTGAEKLSFLGTASALGTNTDAVTGFTATATSTNAADTIHLNFLATAVVTPASVVGTGTLLTDLNAAVAATGIAANTADFITITGSAADAGSYIVANTNGGGAAVAAGAAVFAAGDTAIKMVGLTGTLTSSNFV
jgi:hypothetical protein